MVPLLVAASSAMALYAKSRYPKMQLDAAKATFVESLQAKSDEIEFLLKEFEAGTKCSVEDKVSFVTPFAILEDSLLGRTKFSDASIKFNHALKYNSGGKRLGVYQRILAVQSRILAIDEPEVLEWYRVQADTIAQMIHELFYDYNAISYASTGVLIERLIDDKLNRSEEDLSTIAQDPEIADRKKVLKFIEAILNDYLEHVITSALNYPMSPKEQGVLNNKLNIIKFAVTRNTAIFKSTTEDKAEIARLVDTLEQLNDPFLRRRQLSTIARIKSKLVLDAMELYLFQLLKAYFFEPRAKPDEYLQEVLLYAYAPTMERYRAFYEDRFVRNDIYVSDEPILFKHEHTDFVVPPQLLIDIERTAKLFNMPFPDFAEVFKDSVPDSRPASPISETVNVPSPVSTTPKLQNQAPPIPARPLQWSKKPPAAPVVLYATPDVVITELAPPPSSPAGSPAPE